MVRGVMIFGIMIWEWWVVVYEEWSKLRGRMMIRYCDRSSTEDYCWG